MLRFLCDITGLETGAGLTRVLAARGAGVGVCVPGRLLGPRLLLLDLCYYLVHVPAVPAALVVISLADSLQCQRHL